MHYKAIVSYCGTEFIGWQRQYAQDNSIQGTIEQAISKVANHDVSVVCAGRTDKGVHASGQVIGFVSDAARRDDQWLLGINAILPRSIRMMSIRCVRPDFSARFSADQRHYVYRIDNRRQPQGIWHAHALSVRQPLNIDLMTQGAYHLLGEHDFSAFRSSQCQAKSPIRTLHDICIQRHDDDIIVTIKGNAFLHHMVRNIMGVLIPIGLAKQSPCWAKRVLLSKDRRQGGITQAAHALTLIYVHYPIDYAI